MKKQYVDPKISFVTILISDIISSSSLYEEPVCDIADDIFF